MSSLNRMCLGCEERGESCNGTTCHTWTGCAYRTSSANVDNGIVPIMSREDLIEKGVLISHARKEVNNG